MTFTVASLGSGSQGNAFLVESETARVLIDAGFSGVKLARRLESLDVEPRSINVVVVTHALRYFAGRSLGKFFAIQESP